MPSLVGSEMCIRDSPGIAYYPPRAAVAIRTPGWGSASSQWGWGFHTMRCGIDPGDHHFCRRVVGVIHAWKDSCCGDGTLSSPGRAGPTNPRLRFISGSNEPVELGFPHHSGLCRPRGSPASSPLRKSCTCMEIVESGHGTLSSPGGACLLYTSPSPRD